MTDVAECPSQEILQAFVLGRVGPDELDRLAGHVEHCVQCVSRLHRLESRDTLLESVRSQGHARSELTAPQLEGLIAQLCLQAPAAATPSNCADRPTAADANRADITAEITRILRPPEQPDEIGRLGGYRILSVLGAGGMGVVFRAEDVALCRCAAVKVLRPALLDDGEARERFLREVRMAASLTHDHVVPILHLGDERGLPYLCMPLLDGETLEKRLLRQTSLPIPEVLRLSGEIASGLAAAHAHGLIHRDIKPANIFLEAVATGTGADCRVKILDFGLARTVQPEGELTHSGAILGTPGYMAPEQARGEHLDASCDLFGLGCVMYRMTTGGLPFKSSTDIVTLRSALEQPPVPPCVLNPEVPQALSDLVLLLLATEPGNRPPSAARVLVEINTIARGTPSRPRRFFTARRIAVLAALLLVLAPACYLLAPVLFRTATNQDEPERNKRVGPNARLATDPWLIDELRRQDIPTSVLAIAGDGDPEKAPQGLVAILGDGRLKHWRDIHSVAFSPDGTILASGSYDRTVKLWDPANGNELRTLVGHPSEVKTVAFSSDGKLLASGSMDGTVKLWDPASGKNLEPLSLKHQGTVNWIALSGDGKLVASAGWEDNTVKLWQVSTGNWTLAKNPREAA